MHRQGISRFFLIAFLCPELFTFKVLRIEPVALERVDRVLKLQVHHVKESFFGSFKSTVLDEKKSELN